MLEELKRNSNWEEYINHKFLQMMAENSLSRSVFRYYLIQDAKYVEEMLRALFRASALAPLEDAINILTQILLTRDKGLETNQYLYKSLGITKEEIMESKMNDVNYAYTRHLNYWAERSWEKFLIAWTPCMVGYYEASKRIEGKVKDELYKAWVSFYASNEYKKRVDAIVSSLEKVNVDFDEALEIFNRSVNYEIAFWDEALKQGI